jgi:hypothetical protein
MQNHRRSLLGIEIAARSFEKHKTQILFNAL